MWPHLDDTLNQIRTFLGIIIIIYMIIDVKGESHCLAVFMINKCPYNHFPVQKNIYFHNFVSSFNLNDGGKCHLGFMLFCYYVVILRVHNIRFLLLLYQREE